MQQVVHYCGNLDSPGAVKWIFARKDLNVYL